MATLTAMDDAPRVCALAFGPTRRPCRKLGPAISENLWSALRDHARMARDRTRRELRNECGDIERQLDEGEGNVTRSGVPVEERTPLRSQRFVVAEASVAMFRTAPIVDHDRFRADLDQVVDQGSEPRR